MKINVFLVSTLHQLQQVRCVIKEFDLQENEVNVIYLSFNAPEDISQYLPFKCSFENIENWTFKDFLTNRGKYKIFYHYLKELKQEYDEITLFSSQYFSDTTLLALTILKPVCFFLMDEGTASFKVVKKRSGSMHRSFKQVLKSFLYLLPIKTPDSITYFTQYDLKVNNNDQIYKYSFGKEENQLQIRENYVIVLGSSIASVDVVSIESYMSILMALKERLNGKMVDYYPHRKENKDLLNQIKNIGFNIKRSEKPFEFVYSSLEYCPEAIYSFISPVLDNISKQYVHYPSLFIIQFNEKYYLNDENISIYNDIYEAYKQNSQLRLLKL